MTYTPEQLKGMSDADVNAAVKWIVFGDGWSKERALVEIDFCQDWSATGPLTGENNISLLEGVAMAEVYYEENIGPYGKYESRHENPLRAICEVLLQLNQE